MDIHAALGRLRRQRENVSASGLQEPYSEAVLLRAKVDGEVLAGTEAEIARVASVAPHVLVH